jgi:3-phenylpropionate/trans-cinnamate dioxygenase ferredoxin subunit
MQGWIAVCGELQLAEGEFQVVWDGDTSIAVYRTAEGWFAVEDVCTHDGAELAGGPVHGCVVECPRHGARFDLRTGEALCAPAYTPIAVFPVKLEGGVVYTRDDRE